MFSWTARIIRVTISVKSAAIMQYCIAGSACARSEISQMRDESTASASCWNRERPADPKRSSASALLSISAQTALAKSVFPDLVAVELRTCQHTKTRGHTVLLLPHVKFVSVPCVRNMCGTQTVVPIRSPSCWSRSPPRHRQRVGSFGSRRPQSSQKKPVVQLSLCVLV